MVERDSFIPAYAPASIQQIIEGGQELHPVELAVSALFRELRATDMTNHSLEIVKRNDDIMFLRLGIGSCAATCSGVECPQTQPTAEAVHTLAQVGALFGRSHERVRGIQLSQTSRAHHMARKPFRDAIAEALLAIEPDQEVAATRYGAGRLLVKTGDWYLPR
jgi:hypothetical protein